MAEANFNLVLDAEARFAAADMQKRLGIPYIELTRLYQLDKIKNQYTLFAAALGSKFDDDAYFEEALAAKEALRKSIHMQYLQLEKAVTPMHLNLHLR